MYDILLSVKSVYSYSILEFISENKYNRQLGYAYGVGREDRQG